MIDVTGTLFVDTTLLLIGLVGIVRLLDHPGYTWYDLPDLSVQPY
jgi:hypothetical protein